MSNKNTQTICMNILGTEFTFNVGRQDFNRYINNISGKDKIAPSFNFVSAVVKEDQKQALVEIMQQNPGAEMKIAGEIYETYVPDLSIVVKQSSGLPTE